MLASIKPLGKKIVGTLFANDYPRLIRFGAFARPNYAYIVYQAADLARRLGLAKISVLEFGVAGGRGLVNLEMHAEQVSKLTSVDIEVYGFDTGEGLPPPEDYRDLPYIWQANHFRMDQDALRAQLKRAKLVLGLVEDTVRDFVAKYDPAPVGAISFDLDYYSSTKHALKILEISPDRRLPRILAYMDDIYSSDLGHIGPRVGVPLAIAEFNQSNPTKDISPLTHLESKYAPVKAWHRQIFSCSDFEHPRFNEYIVGGDRQLAL